MKRRAAFFSLILFSTILIVALYPRDRFADIEERIEQKYKVPNIGIHKAKKILSSPQRSRYVVFDVRQNDEFTTSHIENALYVNPDMNTGDFIRAFAPVIKNKYIIFYCSVGDRSSRFLKHVQKRSLQEGGILLYNLKGGIFSWYNEGYPVINDKGITDDIHPYDEYWGSFIEKRETTENY